MPTCPWENTVLRVRRSFLGRPPLFILQTGEITRSQKPVDIEYRAETDVMSEISIHLIQSLIAQAEQYARGLLTRTSRDAPIASEHQLT